MRVAAYLIPGADLPPAIDLAARAETLGYESVWVTHGLGRDSFLVLQAYGSVSRKLRLGNGVVPIYPRHPIAMAQSALTLSEMSGGRHILGIGVSHRASMESMLGLELAEPLVAMREYVAVLRGALKGRVSFQGKYYRVEWSLGLPTAPPAPPIYLAGLSRKMLELAGEIADGVVLWLCPPGYVRDVARPALEQGRRRAGKPLEGFEIVAAVPLAVTNDPPAAMKAFRSELVRYLQLPFYRAMLEASGLGADIAAFDRDGEVPEHLAHALGAVGDPERAKAFVAAYRSAGVTLPTIRPITFPDAPWYRRTLEEAAAW